ncbi:VOC family protein [Aliifodinibius sp. S!AR15-10]|nr:VOC family protein [Aliifodinibius sp. S!AR15-10]
MKTPGIHHISLRVSDFEHARNFYIDILGFQIAHEQENLVIFLAGNTAIGILPAQEPGEFKSLRTGLDHLALGCENESELKRVATALADAGIENTGIKKDETLGKLYVNFKDPDRISWEFYMV